MFTCHSLSLLHISLRQTSRGNIEETRQRARRASPSPAKLCQRSIQIQNSLCARLIAYIQTPNSVVKRSIWWSILWNRASRCEEVKRERGGRAGFLHTRLRAKTGTCIRRATHSRAHLREVCLWTFVRDRFGDVVRHRAWTHVTQKFSCPILPVVNFDFGGRVLIDLGN